jgi:hypothetical protein
MNATLSIGHDKVAVIVRHPTATRRSLFRVTWSRSGVSASGLSPITDDALKAALRFADKSNGNTIGERAKVIEEMALAAPDATALNTALLSLIK